MNPATITIAKPVIVAHLFYCVAHIALAITPINLVSAGFAKASVVVEVLTAAYLTWFVHANSVHVICRGLPSGGGLKPGVCSIPKIYTPLTTPTSGEAIHAIESSGQFHTHQPFGSGIPGSYFLRMINLGNFGEKEVKIVGTNTPL